MGSQKTISGTYFFFFLGGVSITILSKFSNEVLTFRGGFFFLGGFFAFAILVKLQTYYSKLAPKLWLLMLKTRQKIDAVLEYLYFKRKEEKETMIDEITSAGGLLSVIEDGSEIERILKKLRDDKYIQIYPAYYRLGDGKQDMKRGLHTFCTVTFEGMLFWESGGYTKDLQRKKIIEFPKNYWWLIAIFTFIIGFFADVIKERLKQKISPKSIQSPPRFPVANDSVPNRRTN